MIVPKFARRRYVFRFNRRNALPVLYASYKCHDLQSSRDVTKINALKRETCCDWTGRSVNR